jgi:hypothetical protein
MHDVSLDMISHRLEDMQAGQQAIRAGLACAAPVGAIHPTGPRMARD